MRPEDGWPATEAGGSHFPKDGRGSSSAGQGSPTAGEGGGQPRGGQTRLQPRWSRSPQEGAGGLTHCTGGVGRLTKASLAVLKAAALEGTET